MKKKKYESPKIEEIQLETSVIIAGSVGTGNGDGTDSEFEGGARAPKRNFWDD
jgi:hypothetical protein